MAAQVFWAVFYSSRRPSQIGPTADFDGAAIPPPIFSMPDSMNFLPTGNRTIAEIVLSGNQLILVHTRYIDRYVFLFPKSTFLHYGSKAIRYSIEAVRHSFLYYSP